jgi:hypothetical protein
MQPLSSSTVWTNVTYPHFVRNQTAVTNTTGFCAYVASAILLGYFDHVTANRNMGIINPSTNHVLNRHATHAQIQQSFVDRLRIEGGSLGYGILGINTTQIRNVIRSYLQGRNVWNNISDTLITTASGTTNNVIANHIRADRPVILVGTGLPGPSGPIGGHGVVGYGFRNTDGVFTVRANYGWGSGGNIAGQPFSDVWVVGFDWSGLVTLTVTPLSSSGC